MYDELRELWRYRELLWTMVVRELRVRYKNSVLGFFWSLLNPLVTAIVLTIVFKFFVRVKIENYSVYVFAAYFPWVFFQMALLDSAQSVLTYMPLIKKIYFPREILPLGFVVANFIHFLLSMGVFLLYLIGIWVFVPGHQLPLRATALLAPLVIVVHLALTTGLAFYISALNAFYEDVKYVVAVGLQLLFYLSPIVYFSGQVRHPQQVGEQYHQAIYWVYHLNPLATLLSLYRKLMLPDQPLILDGGVAVEASPLEPAMVVVAIVASLAIATGGYAYFNRHKWKFAERA